MSRKHECDFLYCHNQGTKRCSKCKQEAYCSLKCQRNAWIAGHKFNCQTLANENDLRDQACVPSLHVEHDEYNRVVVPRSNMTNLLFDVDSEAARVEKEERILGYSFPVRSTKEAILAARMAQRTLQVPDQDHAALDPRVRDATPNFLSYVLDEYVHNVPLSCRGMMKYPFPRVFLCAKCNYPAVFANRCPCEYCVCDGLRDGRCVCAALSRIVLEMRRPPCLPAKGKDTARVEEHLFYSSSDGTRVSVPPWWLSQLNKNVSRCGGLPPHFRDDPDYRTYECHRVYRISNSKHQLWLLDIDTQMLVEREFRIKSITEEEARRLEEE